MVESALSVEEPDVLRGLHVLEVDTDLHGHFAGRALAAMGATVWLAEPRSGSASRAQPPLAPCSEGGMASVPFEALNLGKHVVALDRQQAEDRAALVSLATDAELVILDPEAWSDLRGELTSSVVVVTSLYGLGGRAGRELVASSPFTRYAAGGDMSFLPTSHDRSLRPTAPGRLTGEGLAGTGLVLAAMHGLRCARETGQQQVVDFCQQAYLVTLNKMFVSQASYFRAEHNRFSHSYPFGGNVACVDGFAAVLVLEQRQWEGLCRMVGAPEWIDDPRYADGVLRRRNGAPLDRAVKRWCAERTVDEVIAAARAEDVPVGRVATPSELLARRSLTARGFIATAATRFGSARHPVLPFGPRFTSPGRSSAAAETPQRRLRVLDLTWAGAGPIISWTLAAIGAEVAKVEHPSRPDLLRRANRTYGWAEDDDLDGSPAFNELNAGKRSVVANLGTEAGRDVVRRLAASCDVLCESMRPGKLESLGLGYDAVRSVNPSVVYCSLSATGRGTGEPVDLPGYAPIFWAEGGGAWLSGWPQADPDYIRSPPDMHAGNFACAGILAALERRARTGAGSYVDLSAIEAVAATLGDAIMAADLGVDDGRRQGNLRPPWLFNDVLPCQGEEAWLAVSAAHADHWNALCETLGVECDPPTAGAVLEDAELSRLADATRHRPAEELESLLQTRGVPASRVRTMRDLLDDEALLQRGYWQDVSHPVLGVQRLSGLAWRINGADGAALEPSPLLDADTDDVLRDWLDLEDDEIEQLRADGAVGGTQASVASPG